MLLDFVLPVPHTSGVWPHVTVKHEIPKNLDPRGVIWVVIILRCDFPHFRKTVIWNIREIMMFYMITHVKQNKIERTVI